MAVKLASGRNHLHRGSDECGGRRNLGIGDFTWTAAEWWHFSWPRPSGIASDALTVTGILTKQGQAASPSISPTVGCADLAATTYTLINITGTTNFTVPILVHLQRAPRWRRQYVRNRSARRAKFCSRKLQ